MGRMSKAKGDSSITIDDEFRDLIRTLDDDEKRELENSIVEYGGAREPLIVWGRGDDETPVLVDGHNRYEICTRLGLPYQTTALEFDSREDVIRWIERNQLGRRNLSHEDFTLVLGRLYNRAKRPIGGRPQNDSPERTSERFAKEFGLDKRTIERAGAFQKAAEKLGLEKAISSGRIHVSRPQLVAAAKSLPDDPTGEQVSEALRKAHRPAAGKKLLPSSPQGWLVPAEPTECLKAIRFYATTFVMQAPDSIVALNNMLIDLVQENNCRVA